MALTKKIKESEIFTNLVKPTKLVKPTVFNKNLKKCKTKDNIASNLKITMITVCSSLGSQIGLLEIFDYYIEVGNESFELVYIPNSKEKNGEKNKAFNNCLNINFYYIDCNSIEHKISCKLFSNGSLTISGCLTIEAVHNTSKIIYNFVKKIHNEYFLKTGNKIIKDVKNFKLSNVRIGLINAMFSFSNKINLEKLTEILNKYRFSGEEENEKEIYENVWRLPSFRPEKYCAINTKYMTKRCRDKFAELITEEKPIPIKLEGQLTLIIFSTGKCTISSSKSIVDTAELYKIIVTLVRKYQDIVFNK